MTACVRLMYSIKLITVRLSFPKREREMSNIDRNKKKHTGCNQEAHRSLHLRKLTPRQSLMSRLEQSHKVIGDQTRCEWKTSLLAAPQGLRKSPSLRVEQWYSCHCLLQAVYTELQWPSVKGNLQASHLDLQMVHCYFSQRCHQQNGIWRD